MRGGFRRILPAPAGHAQAALSSLSSRSCVCVPQGQRLSCRASSCPHGICTFSCFSEPRAERGPSRARPRREHGRRGPQPSASGTWGHGDWGAGGEDTSRAWWLPLRVPGRPRWWAIRRADDGAGLSRLSSLHHGAEIPDFLRFLFGLRVGWPCAPPPAQAEVRKWGVGGRPGSPWRSFSSGTLPGSGCLERSVTNAGRDQTQTFSPAPRRSWKQEEIRRVRRTCQEGGRRSERACGQSAPPEAVAVGPRASQSPARPSPRPRRWGPRGRGLVGVKSRGQHEVSTRSAWQGRGDEWGYPADMPRCPPAHGICVPKVWGCRPASPGNDLEP